MVTVEFLGPIGLEPMKLEASSFDEVSQLLYPHKDLAEWLPICAVALNDILINDRSISLSDGDRISLLPPVCGG